MKKILILLVVIQIVLQSCHTYKTVNNQELQNGKTYKIVVDNKKLKVKLNQATDSTIVVTHKNEEKIIAKSEIKEIKKRKFSILKTIALPVGIVVGFVGLVAISDPEIGGGATMNFPN